MPPQSCQKSKHRYKYFRGSYFQTCLLKVSWLPLFSGGKRGKLFMLSVAALHISTELRLCCGLFDPHLSIFLSVFLSHGAGACSLCLAHSRNSCQFCHCSSPQKGLSVRQGERVVQRVVHAGSHETSLSVCLFCVVTWAPTPRCIPSAHWILSLQWAGRNNTGGSGIILTESKYLFILTEGKCVIDYICPSPVTPEHLGIPIAPYLAPFNFAAIWAVWRWSEEDY